MALRRQKLLAVCLVCATWAVGCARSGDRPFWKFWGSRSGSGKGAMNVEIPAPPEVVMPNTPLRVLEPPKPGTSVAEPGETKRAPATVVQPALRTVYFDYDSAQLTDETKETLRENANWLREHPQVEVQAQGHCDERGTVEYNFNLGQRRAESVKSFLGSLGISPNRIHTISYGEERPAVQGHVEESWRLNRRVEFHTY